MSIQEITKSSGNLPASEIVNEVNDSLNGTSSLVITAPPGAGKSTLLPLTILHTLPKGSTILMLEPRRIAARQIAERMASILNEQVGMTVGYRVRFEKKVSPNTRIEVLTEGILTRMLVNNPTLDNVGAVIFDEFHERSINSDLALALTRQVQSIIRPDLKVIIMSATIDATEICNSLQAPLIESKGRMFPVEVHYADEDCDQFGIVPAAVNTVKKAHAEHKGDILVFLPGQAEISKCCEALGASLGETGILPLYSNLSPEQQHNAITPSSNGRRKVVLATPIAETSLTIEGVRIVIDSGFCRTLQFDTRTGLSHLDTVRITRDMATQRTGRAGRMAEGVCYRLWTRHLDHTLAEQRKAEILDADLSSLVLDIAAFGENDILSLPWLTMPPKGSLYQAKALLTSLNAIDDNGDITDLGKRMAQIPCHPRISCMILHAITPGQKALACDIAALLEEKDPMGDSPDTDISSRIAVLRRHRRQHSLGRWARIAHIAEEYRRRVNADINDNDIAPQEAGALVARAYPERIAKSTDNIGNYRLSSGGNVRLDATDSISAYQWLAIASLNTNGNSGRVFLATPVDEADLKTLASQRDNISWDTNEQKIITQRETMIGKLLIESCPIHDTDKVAVTSVICDAVKKHGLSMLDWNDSVQRLQRRIAKVAEWHPELNLPDLSTKHLMECAADWLPFYLENGGRLRSSASELKKIDLAEAIWALVPYDLQQEVDRIAPSHITVPTGSRIRIDYRHGAEAPVVSVRLQECFGLTDTPCIDGGSQPLLMELLSPGFKPVQLTQDLHSFWQNTYFEVRKELRRRYPKHYWPDNPLEAEATRGAKKAHRG